MPIPTDKLFGMAEKLIAQMREAHELLTQQPNLAPGDKTMLEMIDDWVRRIAGALEGHGSEFELYYKHRIKKRREIRDKRSKIADVAIGGDNDDFAKAIQSKSTLQTSHNAIDGYIRDAFVQLTGEKGENPRPNDRPVIHMKIWDLGNPWPYTAATAQTPSFAELRSTVVARVTEVIKNEINQRLSQVTFSMSGATQSENKVQGFVDTFPVLPATGQIVLGSNRPNATPQYIVQHQGQNYLLKTLVVKIKWPFGLLCTNGNKPRFVESFTLVGARNGTSNQFIFNVEKEEFSDPPDPRMVVQNLLN